MSSRRLAPALALVALAGCAHPSPGASPSSPAGSAGPVELEVHPCQSGYSRGAWNSPFDTDSVEIRGDRLVARVRYPGGCEEHRFDACYSSFLESSPVQVQLELGHQSTDTCQLPVTAELHIDLRPLADRYRQAYRKQSGDIDVGIPGAGRGRYSF